MGDSVFQLIVDRSHDDASATRAPSSFVIPSNWHGDHVEGQLAVDVVESRDALHVIAPMAGVDSGRIEIYIHSDLLTIRGVRQSPVPGEKIVETYCSECFWGVCSRTIVLPVHVKGDLATAEYRHGVLTIRLPKAKGETHVPITVVEE